MSASGDAAIARCNVVSATLDALSPTCMCAALIGAGGNEFTIDPSGQRRSKVARMPSLYGRSRARNVQIMTPSSAPMMYGFELKKWAVCGEAPSKSKVRWSPATVSVHGIS